jgi:hypothetical protein
MQESVPSTRVGEVRGQTWERLSELPVLAELLSEDSDEGDATDTEYGTKLAGRVF